MGVSRGATRLAIIGLAGIAVAAVVAALPDREGPDVPLGPPAHHVEPPRAAPTPAPAPPLVADSVYARRLDMLGMLRWNDSEAEDDDSAPVPAPLFAYVSATDTAFARAAGESFIRVRALLDTATRLGAVGILDDARYELHVDRRAPLDSILRHGAPGDEVLDTVPVLSAEVPRTPAPAWDVAGIAGAVARVPVVDHALLRSRSAQLAEALRLLAAVASDTLEALRGVKFSAYEFVRLRDDSFTYVFARGERGRSLGSTPGRAHSGQTLALGARQPASDSTAPFVPVWSEDYVFTGPHRFLTLESALRVGADHRLVLVVRAVAADAPCGKARGVFLGPAAGGAWTRLGAWHVACGAG